MRYSGFLAVAFFYLIASQPGFGEEADIESRKAIIVEFMRKSNPGCALPEAPRDHDLYIVSVSESKAVTNLNFVGLKYPELDLATIEIEPGSRPIELAGVSVLPKIWEFTGATERLSRVTLFTINDKSANGVIGLPRDHVRLVDMKQCGLVHIEQDIRSATGDPRALEKFRVLLGRTPDKAFALDESALLPSGDAKYRTERPSGTLFVIEHPNVRQSYRLEFDKDGKSRKVDEKWIPKLSPDLEEFEELLTNYPEGARKLDPSDVVTNVPLEINDRIARFLK